MPRAEFHNDPLTELEAEAYQATPPCRPSPESKDGPPEYAPAYVTGVLRPWPRHTDFTPDEMEDLCR